MKVSIIGAAGTVGSCTAYTIADQGLAQELVMLDTKQNVLKSHVMDITAAMVVRRDVEVRAGTYEDMSGSDVVIISAGVHFPGSAPIREKLKPNIPIIRDIGIGIEKYCPEAIVITATNPVDLLNYALYLSTSLERKRVIGYNLNDSIRFRMMTASELGISPSRVEAVVIGEHPKAPVMLFSSIRVDGKSYPVEESVKVRIQEEIRNYLKSYEALNSGRTAGWTSAAGLATIVRAICEDSGQVMPCSAVVDGEYGYKGISMGVPAVIGGEGIEKILEWELPPSEHKELKIAADALQDSSKIVREVTGSNRP